MSSHHWLNGVGLSEALGLSPWLIKGIRKANRIFAEQGKEPRIFTGRLSTPARVSQWLADHPDFVSVRFICPSRGEQGPGVPKRQPRPSRLPRAA